MGYHAWTFGWIIGEIVRRADGRSLAQETQEELCRPLGIDSFFLGIPDEVESRVAALRQEPPIDEQTRLAKLAMPRGFTNGETANRPDVRRASMPGAGGIMNARAMAATMLCWPAAARWTGSAFSRPGTSIAAFGHNGHGGSLGFADPQRRLGFGLTRNLLKAGLYGTKPRRSK